MSKLICLFSMMLLSVTAFSQGNASGNFSDSSSYSIEQIYLTAVTDAKDHYKIRLKWTCAPLIAEQFFTVEKSRDGKTFEVIGGIKGRRGEAMFEFSDEMPSGFNNFYRIKASVSENNFIFSKIVSRGISTVQFCKFYPNPVEKYLIIRTESPVEMKISDQLNNVRISKKIEVGLQLVDVSALENGLYVITLLQKESNRIITEKLIKR